MLGVSTGVLMNGQKRGSAAAFHKHFAHAVSGGLGRNHRDVNVSRRLDRPEADIEAMGEHQSLPCREVGRDFFLVDVRLNRVRHQNHDDVGPGCNFSDCSDRQAAGLGFGSRFAAGGQSDSHVNAAVLQVESVGVALGAIANDGDFLAPDERDIGGILVIHLRHDVPLFDRSAVGRTGLERK